MTRGGEPVRSSTTPTTDRSLGRGGAAPRGLRLPITDLATVLDYPGLVADAREVLRSLAFHEQQIRATDGRWFTVQIMPYRRQDDRIDGILQGRSAGQTVELDAANALEIVLQKAQIVLEKRFTDQTAELRKVRADVQTAMGGTR